MINLDFAAPLSFDFLATFHHLCVYQYKEYPFWFFCLCRADEKEMFAKSAFYITYILWQWPIIGNTSFTLDDHQ